MESLRELLRLGISPVGREAEIIRRFISVFSPPGPLAHAGPDLSAAIHGTCFISASYYPELVRDAFDEVGCDLKDDDCSAWYRRFTLDLEGAMRATGAHPLRILEALIRLYKRTIHPLSWPQEHGVGGIAVADPSDGFEPIPLSALQIPDGVPRDRVICCVLDSSFGDERAFRAAMVDCLAKLGIPRWTGKDDWNLILAVT